jgi:hypothetical protein
VTPYRVIGTNVSEEPAVPVLPTLKMEVEGSSETFVPIYQTTRSHIPEDCNLLSYNQENLKSQKIKNASQKTNSLNVLSPRSKNVTALKI